MMGKRSALTRSAWPADKIDATSSSPSCHGVPSDQARYRLWLTDAYYSGISSYVQALRAAAHDPALRPDLDGSELSGRRRALGRSALRRSDGSTPGAANDASPPERRFCGNTA